ncbi:MAG TPA: response regulator [Anaerolineae bacterium]|nr:response regulator [Anaerolineae bacterium]
MSTPHILVVNNDEGFGFMLKEGLNNTGQFKASLLHTGSDALQAVVENSYDLVIVDIAITDMHPGKLIQGIRHAKKETKVMMTPLMGRDLPRQFKELSLDGILPKPFFVGDLPDLINKALGRIPPPMAEPVAEEAEVEEPEVVDVETTPSVPPAPVPPMSIAERRTVPILTLPTVSHDTTRFLRANETEILRLLSDLNREVRAEAILLIAGTNLIAQAGMVSREKGEELTALVAQSSEAAAQAARFLGERAGRFTQSLHEGDSYRLYTLTLADGILLSLALSTNVPLGMIRHQCRQIAEKMEKYII